MKKSKVVIYSEYLVFYLFSRFLLLMPRRCSFMLADMLGSAGYWLLGSRRNAAMINLGIAFGKSLSVEEREKLAKKSFQSFLRCSFDFIQLAGYSSEKLMQDIVRVNGYEHAEKAFGRGKGVIMIGLHFGNWELIPQVHGILNLPQVSVVARRFDNPLIEKTIYKLRSDTGNKFIHKDNAARTIFSELKKNHAIGILFDQNTAVGGVFVDFFGKKAATNKAVASFAVATGATILPIVSIPDGNGTYNLVYGPEISYNLTGNKNLDITTITRRCNKFIENTIKADPTYWLWGHKRWKTRPDGEEKIYPC